MNKPVTITSPTNALAVSIYFFQIALGIAHVLDLATAKSMEQLVGATVADAWGLILIFGGLAASGSVLAASREPVRALKLEAPAALVLAIAAGLYETSLFIVLGPSEALTTQMVMTSICVGCATRAFQARRDRIRAVRAVRTNTVAVVAGEGEEG